MMKHALTILTLLAIGCVLCAAADTLEKFRIEEEKTADGTLVKNTYYAEDGVLKNKRKQMEEVKDGKRLVLDEYDYNDKGYLVEKRRINADDSIYRYIYYDDEELKGKLKRSEWVKERKFFSITEYVYIRDDKGDKWRVETEKRDGYTTIKTLYANGSAAHGNVRRIEHKTPKSHWVHEWTYDEHGNETCCTMTNVRDYYAQEKNPETGKHDVKKGLETNIVFRRKDNSLRHNISYRDIPLLEVPLPYVPEPLPEPSGYRLDVADITHELSNNGKVLVLILKNISTEPIKVNEHRFRTPRSFAFHSERINYGCFKFSHRVENDLLDALLEKAPKSIVILASGESLCHEMDLSKNFRNHIEGIKKDFSLANFDEEVTLAISFAELFPIPPQASFGTTDVRIPIGTVAAVKTRFPEIFTTDETKTPADQ